MRDRDERFASDCQQVDIGSLVRQVLFRLHPEIEKRNVNVETDVTEVLATINCDTIENAIHNLVQHALNAMPQGGELSLTLIDGNYQWELEVADSSSAVQSEQSNPLKNASDLPFAVPYILDRFLVDAHRMALRHGGQIQTWDCPQGGMANVLVIPKRNRKRNRQESRNPAA